MHPKELETKYDKTEAKDININQNLICNEKQFELYPMPKVILRLL